MPLLLLVICTHTLGPWPSLLNFTTALAKGLHSFCLNSVPIDSAYFNLNSAILCGDSIYVSQHLEAIKSLGLIHLFVVSGFHIQVIYRALTRYILKHVAKKHLFAFAVIFPYCLACQLNPPVFRALLLLYLPICPKTPSSLKSLIVGITALTINPTLWSSLSLQISWLAVLIISIKKISVFYKLLLLYLVTLLILSPLSIANPASIFLAITLTPLFLCFVFPLNFISLLFSKATILLTIFWENLLIIANYLLQYLPFIQFNLQLSPSLKWVLLITINLGLYIFEIYQKRCLLCDL